MEHALVAVVSDLHINSTVGLLCPSVKLDDGGTFKASKAQRWLWGNWRDYWKQVDDAKKRYGYPVVAVINGEVADNNYHSRTQMITRNESDIISMATKTMTPCLDVADYVFVTRGTAAHVGESASLDEIMARELGAVPDGDAYSWWHLPAIWGGVKFDICHHSPSRSGRPYTKASPAARIAFDLMFDFIDDIKNLPDVALRSHFHSFSDSGDNYPVRAFVTYGWQLKTAYVNKFGDGGRVMPVGGMLFTCEKGSYSYKNIHYAGKRRAYWTAK